MARICLDYECEPREGQRRPASLLDALEREDGSRGDDGAAGQEKVGLPRTSSPLHDLTVVFVFRRAGCPRGVCSTTKGWRTNCEEENVK